MQMSKYLYRIPAEIDLIRKILNQNPNSAQQWKGCLYCLHRDESYIEH